jgi:hypothetical protein
MLVASPLFAGSYFALNPLTKLLSANVIPEGKGLAALETLRNAAGRNGFGR